MHFLNYLKFVVLVGLLSFFLFCSGKKDVKEYNFKPKIDSLISSLSVVDTIHKFDICRIYGEDWDSIAIIKPYARQENLEQLYGLYNYTFLKENILGAINTDHACTFLLIKNNHIVGYSEVERSGIDFAHLGTKDQLDMLFLSKGFCDKIYLKKIGEYYQAFFL